MSQRIISLISLIIIILVIGGVGYYLYRNMTPTQSEIKGNITEPVQIIPGDILDNKEVKEDLPRLLKKGNVPIIIAPDELGRTNPFLPR